MSALIHRAFVLQAHKVTYVMPTGRKVLEVSPTTTLLKAAVAAGLDVPSVCGAGSYWEKGGVRVFPVTHADSATGRSALLSTDHAYRLRYMPC